MSFPTFKLEFTKDGSVHDETQVDEILKNIDQFSDYCSIGTNRIYSNRFYSS